MKMQLARKRSESFTTKHTNIKLETLEIEVDYKLENRLVRNRNKATKGLPSAGFTFVALYEFQY